MKKKLSLFSFFILGRWSYPQLFLLVPVIYLLYTCGSAETVQPEVEPTNKITVTFNGNYLGSDNATKITINQGSKVSIVNPSRDGHKFLGWSRSASDVSLVNLELITFDKDTTLYAQWEKVPFSVSFNLNYPGVTDTPPPTQMIIDGNLVKKPATTYNREHYIFVNWYDNKEGLGSEFNFKTETVKTDKILYAKWDSITFNVVFRLNYTTTTSPPLEQTVNSGNMARKPVPTPVRNNYKLEGWHENAQGTDDAFMFTSTPILGNKTFYAKWSKSTFKVEFNLNYDGATDPPPVQSIEKNSKVKIPDIPIRLHYTFDKWYENAQGNSPSYDFNTNIIEDKTLYATWIKNQYMVSFNLQYPESTNPLPDQIIYSGEKASVPSEIPLRQGFSLVGWYSNPNGEGDVFDFLNTPIVKKTVLYAIWSENLVVYFNTLGGTSINPQSVPIGGKATLPTTKTIKKHCNFDGWYLNEQGSGSKFDFENTTIETNITLYAKWTPIVFIVKFNLNYLNPTSSIQDQIVNSGSVAIIPPNNPLRTYFDFVNWFETEEKTEGEIAFDFSTKIISAKTLYARWKIKSHSIDFNLNYDGATNPPETQNVDSGQLAQEPTAPIREGYMFKGWYESQNPTSENNAFMFSTTIRNNILLYAKWERVKFKVTFIPNYNDEFGVAVPKFNEEIINAGDLIVPPLTSPKRKGYNFVNWYNSYSGIEPPFDFNDTINQNTTLYAKWAIGNRVTFNSNDGTYVESQLVSQGDLVDVTVTPTKNHYNFVHWYFMENGNEIIFDFSKKIITSDITLYAKWTPIQFIVSFDLNYDNPTQVAPPNKTINSGTLVPEPPKIYTRTHYEILYWFEKKNNTEVIFDFENSIIKESTTLYARWKNNVYIVTFHRNHTDATGTSNFEKIVLAENELTNIENPTREYYTFKGWYSKATPDVGDVPFSFVTTPIIKNTEVYAKWSRNQYVVSFNVNYVGATYTPSNQVIFGGDKVNQPSTPIRATNFFFIGWFTSDDVKYDFDSIVISTFTLTAKWSDIGNLVEFDTGGGNSIAPQRIADNSYATNPGDAVYTGHYFQGWFSDSAKTIRYQFETTPITEQTTIYAKYIKTVTPANKAELINQINIGIATYGQNGDLNYIDTKLIDDLDNVFSDSQQFNGDISKWNVSNVITMINTFSNTNEFNGDLSKWNVSNVTNMYSMFANAKAFNGNVGNWNVEKVSNMHSMFYSATNFNQPIGNWNINSLQTMLAMFAGATAFNQNINDWNISKVEDMSYLFDNSNFNSPLDNWNLSSTLYLNAMFSNNPKFNQDISSWNVSNVQTMISMFSNATAFNQNINDWNVRNLVNMSSMFGNASAFNQPLDKWNVSKVAIMLGVFNGAFTFNQNIGSWNVSKVINFTNMFQNATLFNQNLDNWNVKASALKIDVFSGSAMENNKPNWAN